MAIYNAPQKDMRFLLHEVFGTEQLQGLPGFEVASPELYDQVLEESSKFTESVLLPLNRTGDEQGLTFENGVVRLPDGFVDAYEQFKEAGWMSLSASPDYGGQGLPKLMKLAVDEMVCSTNLSFGMIPGLSAGAYNAIFKHATDDLKETYLPKLVDGNWSGTMCLTEPQCGTDLGLIKTRAEPLDDGTYALTGTKIFISAGEHDATQNIIHLVLARLPDAPEGIKGISLFLVPKFLPNEEGEAGPRNGISCGSIEHKMGIHASPTCVMNLDEAKGWLIGQDHKGMRAMFTMMNDARLEVGIQGLGLAETAYQSAVAYATERRQGRALTGAAEPDAPADNLLVHPDVRRMLLIIRATNEGARALAYWVGMHLDISEHHLDAEERQRADDLVALMTPIVKAYFTDQGFENTNLAMQCLGGHGYIREWGMEQLVRDARIAQIYEGANGVQALDLVGRKMGSHFGRLLRRFFHPVQAFIEAQSSDPAMMPYVLPLAKAFGRLQQATLSLAERGLKNPDEAGAASRDYLRLFALVSLAYMWGLMVRQSLDALEGECEDPDFYKTKLTTADFFMKRVLTENSMLFANIMDGADTLMTPKAESFAA